MEKLNPTSEQICKGMGFYREKDNGLLSRDILLNRDGKDYVITVSTPEYWKAVQDSGEEEGSSPHYVMDNVSEVDEVCKKLAEISTEELTPFLTESSEE